MRPRLSATLGMFGILASCSTAAPAEGHASSPTPSAAPAVTGSQPAPAKPGATDWPTYHRDAARTGVAPAQPAAGKLTTAWRRHLDGAVYGQPLVIGGTVIAATEGDSVYSLDRGSGRVRWRVKLGTPVPLSKLPCGDIYPLCSTGTT